MLFAGSRIDALTYFVLTGLTTSVAYDVYDRHERWGGQKASFYLMAGLAGLIHLSSIIGSYNMAVRANESATHRTLENMTVDPFPSPDPALPDGWRRAEVPDCR